MPSFGQNHERPGQLKTGVDSKAASQYGTENIPSLPRTAAGHKRKLDALKPHNETPKKPGPPTAPAVPSFGASFLPSKPSVPLINSSTDKRNSGSTPKGRSLGLTPVSFGFVDAESDNEAENVDEEAMYAELGDKLTFEHNGVVMSLKSQADLIAWKKERQKNWPTKARMSEKGEERRRIGEERRRLLGIAAPLISPLRRSKVSQPAKTEAPASTVVNVDEQIRRLSELRKRVLDSEAKNREARTQEIQGDSTDPAVDAAANPTNEPPDQATEDVQIGTTAMATLTS